MDYALFRTYKPRPRISICEQVQAKAIGTILLEMMPILEDMGIRGASFQTFRSSGGENGGA